MFSKSGATNRIFLNFCEYGLKGVSTKLPNAFSTSFTPYIKRNKLAPSQR